MFEYSQYQVLAFIADLYIPALVLIYVGTAGQYIANKGYAAALSLGRKFGTAALIVYGLMLSDNCLEIFPALGLDYSTHTAAATALIYLLIEQPRKYTLALCVSLVGYTMLMFVQGYHTIADMVVTFGVIIALLHTLKRLKIHRCKNKLKASP